MESSLLAAGIKHAALDFSRSSGDEQHIAFKSGDLNERSMETLIVRNFLAASIKNAVHVLFTLVRRREYIAFKSEDLNERTIYL